MSSGAVFKQMEGRGIDLGDVARAAVGLHKASEALGQCRLLEGLGDMQLMMMASAGKRWEHASPHPPLPCSHA